ncbi:MAG: hypothetical protein J0M04_08235 [Verrucomicrobia bacterium]|nr:hypothetical protein [Verrucomicrobiota bacterium]
MKHDTAGDGSPYWYEWTAGLIKVVEMIYPDSGITSVTFQEAGVKGWDDVVVRYNDGKIDYYQVKHTREGNNLTFGALVGKDDTGNSLLGDLYAAWCELPPKAATSTCTVFTNREAGMNTYMGRPPLLEFTEWLAAEATKRRHIADFEVPEKWSGAWQEWHEALNSETDAVRMDFIRSLRISTNRPDLEDLQAEVLLALAKAFGTSVEKATPLLHALNNALKMWTTGHGPVTPETVLRALTLPSDPDAERPAPPPPTPFFPTREKESMELEKLLVSPDGPRIVFLCADPGAGKTSLLSRIEMRRSEKPLSGIVGLRYYAFLPITPDSRGAPSETDYCVDPKELWFSLLSQLRRDLSGALWKYSVPVRNEMLTWQQARGHVMRLADRIGQELGRDFVIVVDGIDHAARAGRLRYDRAFAEDFFRSLPGPEELVDSRIRLLIAGQPAESYEEYPPWLRAPADGVVTYNLGPLEKADIAGLIEHRQLQMPPSEWDDALNHILTVSGGNTLAVVFAIEEACASTSCEALRQRLENRRIGQGLRHYYDSIWNYALRGDDQRHYVGVETALSGSLCQAREPLSGDYLASAFRGLNYSSDFWHLILVKLGPLIIQDGFGFRVLHNDVRVFLGNRLGEQSPAERAWVSNCLATHYLAPESNRQVAHASLFELLRHAGRKSECARVFTVEWVFEAAALGRPFREVEDQARAALAASLELRDWDVLHELACAVETMGRWENHQRHVTAEDEALGAVPEAFFPPSELVVQSLDAWTVTILQQVTSDANRIVKAGAAPRAIAIMDRWFSGLAFNEIVDHVYPNVDDASERDWNNCGAEDQWFEDFGKICRVLLWCPTFNEFADDKHRRAEYFFEKGWVERSVNQGRFETLGGCFQTNPPRFYANVELAIRKFAELENWRLVGRMLRLFHKECLNFSRGFRLLATWWCVRSGLETRASGWVAPLDDPVTSTTDSMAEIPEHLLSVAKASGWLNPVAEAPVIAGNILTRAGHIPSGEKSGGLVILLHAAVIVGQVMSLLAKNKSATAQILFPPVRASAIVKALWTRNWTRSIESTRYDLNAGRLAEDLVNIFCSLGVGHRDALIEIASPIAAEAPADFRRDGVWRIMMLAGKREVLVEWLNSAIGETGWIWTEGVDSREEVAHEFYIPAAKEIGEVELALSTEKKLKWQRIGYVGHNDYSFQWLCTWFEEVASKNPTAIRSAGFRLLALLNACSRQHGDNRMSSDVRAALGCAAISAGPDDVWRIVFANDEWRSTKGWLDRAKAMFLDGFLDRMKSSMAPEDKLACWCISLAMTRWHDAEDVAVLCDIRDTIFSTSSSDTERTFLKQVVRQISPGEYSRQTSQKQEETDTGDEALDDADWRAELEAGRRLSPAKAANAIRSIHCRSIESRDTEIKRVLELFGINNSMSGGWGHYSGTLKSSLLEIMRMLSDQQVWALVPSAILRCESGGYWYSSVSDNLQALLLARVAVARHSQLESGLNRVLNMHERWACGGDMGLPLPHVRPAEGFEVTSWEDLASRIFATLLSSRYGNVIESAMIGANALISWQPKHLPMIFDSVGSDEWRLRWLLTLAEVWAATCPDAMATVVDRLKHLSVGAPLDIRLHVWIILLILSRHTGIEAPPFEFIDPEDVCIEAAQSRPAGILVTTPEMRGSVRLVDHHQVAASILRKIKTASGMNCDDLAHSIGTRLLCLGRAAEDEWQWPKSIRNDNDWLCTGAEGRRVLNDELDRVILERIGSPAQLFRFAQAFLPSEDGWILRHSPMPHPAIASWPSSDSLGGDYRNPPASADIRNWLRQAATAEGFEDDEQVIAARMKVYSWREDFVYECWYQEQPDRCHLSNGIPTTLNGRSFVWFLANFWWEPCLGKGNRSVGFRTGGYQQLLHCFAEIIPSRIWHSDFGWTPSESNPFVWNRNGIPVVRHEVLHGPLDLHTPHAGRTPILHRWIVKTDAFKNIMESFPKMTWNEEFERVRYKED